MSEVMTLTLSITVSMHAQLLDDMKCALTTL